jgi:hypothetical protein
MYGTFSGISFGVVALVALLVIALAIAASPLFAVIIAVIAAVVMMIVMSAMRQRSAREDQTRGGAPDTHSSGPRARGTGGARATGEPASGEG